MPHPMMYTYPLEYYHSTITMEIQHTNSYFSIVFKLPLVHTPCESKHDCRVRVNFEVSVYVIIILSRA